MSELDQAMLRRLRVAFVAALGVERGSEALGEALLWACEHPDRLADMDNPAGYLFRVGQSRTKVQLRRATFPVIEPREHLFDPKLATGLARLTEPQRLALVLVTGYGMTLREVGELTGRRIPTVQRHLTRAMAKMRDHLGVEL